MQMAIKEIRVKRSNWHLVVSREKTKKICYKGALTWIQYKTGIFQIIRWRLLVNVFLLLSLTYTPMWKLCCRILIGKWHERCQIGFPLEPIRFPFPAMKHTPEIKYCHFFSSSRWIELSVRKVQISTWNLIIKMSGNFSDLSHRVIHKSSSFASIM